MEVREREEVAEGNEREREKEKKEEEREEERRRRRYLSGEVIPPPTMARRPWAELLFISAQRGPWSSVNLLRKLISQTREGGEGIEGWGEDGRGGEQDK